MSVTPSPMTSPIRAPDLFGLAVALLVAYWPTYLELNESVWNVVGQGHGPVMLTLAIWLVVQRWDAFQALPDRPNWGAAVPLMTLGLLSYIVGRSQDVLALDAGSQIFVLAAIALAWRGAAGLKLMWFPLFFMLFLVPLPGSVVDSITGPLKVAVSHVAESLLYLAGYAIGRSGVTLTIGPYQLLVADACAGLNSIFALEAVGVFYLSVARHTHRWRNITLAALILPISFVCNVIRVIVLVLITYYLGDEVGQGFVHSFAGVLLFTLATCLMIGADTLVGLFIPSQEAAPADERAHLT